MHQAAAELEDLWDRPSPFAVPITVGVEHIDELGHTNNVCYLQWLQECAWQHSTAVGFSEKQMAASGYGMAVRETRMFYLAATYPGDSLWVGDWLIKNDGRLRATRAFQILRVADGVCVMRAEVDYICIALDSGKPHRMPKEFVSAFSVLPST